MEVQNFDAISQSQSQFSNIHFENFPKGYSAESVDELICKLFDPLLRVGYYLLLIPFRLKERNGIYHIHTNSVQRVSCFAKSLVTMVKKYF